MLVDSGASDALGTSRLARSQTLKSHGLRQPALQLLTRAARHHRDRHARLTFTDKYASLLLRGRRALHGASG